MAALQSPLLMSPVTPAAGCMAPGSVDLISPQIRRVPTIAAVVVPQLLAEKNDANERKERRRSRLLEMQRRHLNSPATPTDKRKSLTTPSAGLTNAQLTDLYANCIKLSAENKINAKNAFGLHLIDYLSELLKKKEMNNFQVASSTLDASAKIYAGRVDAIHTETYKVLTGLGRSNDRRDADSGDGEEAGDLQDGDPKDPKNKRVRARRKKATVEANLKNINVKKFDMEFEVDPMFQKTSATFDEGGSGGLLLNHLACLDDTSAIAVDLNTEVTTHLNPAGCQRKPTDMEVFRELYGGMELEHLQICPEFAEFSFTNWSRDGDDSIHTPVPPSLSKDTDRRFDLNAEVETVSIHNEDGEGADGDMGLGLPVDDFTGNDDEPSPDTNQTLVERKGDGSIVINLGNSKEAQLIESAMTDLAQGSAGSLMAVLASQPSDYSYFSTNILQSWAGPEHWKLKPKSKDDKAGENDGEKKDLNKKTRKRKEPFELVLDAVDETAQDKAFKETRASTMLTKRTLTKNSKARTTLPEDLQYDAQTLLQLSIKPKVMVKMADTRTNNVDDGVQGYDYANDNDKENFVPDLQDADDNMEDGDVGHTVDFGDVFSQSQEATEVQEPEDEVGNDGDANTTIFKGDNMVLQPHKVAKIEIGYAKTAKRIDVKKLKHSMWNLLCTEKTADQAKTTIAPEEMEEDETRVSEQDDEEVLKIKVDHKKATNVAGEHLFSDLIKDLPNKLSKNMAKSLSVPIAFVCLLHLANEKTLKIEGDADMSDLRITQGLQKLLKSM